VFEKRIYRKCAEKCSKELKIFGKKKFNKIKKVLKLSSKFLKGLKMPRNHSKKGLN
jgi:hypothetical protein